MKKLIYSILALSVLCVSCSGVDPIAWNDNIVSIYNKTLDEIEDFEELISLETIGDTAVNRSINENGTRILVDLDKSIKQVNEALAPSEGDKCQTAVVNLLVAAKEQITVGMKFTSLDEGVSEIQIDNYADGYDEKSNITASKANVFILAQEEFAKVAGFELE